MGIVGEYIGAGITAGIGCCHCGYSGARMMNGGSPAGRSCGGVDGPGDESNDIVELEGDGVGGWTFAKRTVFLGPDAIVNRCSVVECGIDNYQTQ